MRIPPAAKALVKQIEAHFPGVEFEIDEIDGFGVHRLITFHDEIAARLSEASIELGLDPRVAAVEGDEDRLSVRFVPDARADHSSAFVLPLATPASRDEGESVEESQDEVDDESQDEGQDDLSEEELRGTPVAILREMYPQYADLKKAEIIERVLDEA